MNFKGKGSKNIDIMGKIARDVVMKKAMQDKLKMEKKKQVKKQTKKTFARDKTFDDNLSDVSMDSYEEELMRQMKEKMHYQNEQNKHQKVLTGNYQEKSEKEFFDLIENKKEKIVCHFFHDDFVRCKIINKHLLEIAYKHPEALFIRLNAQGSPFLVQKLGIRVLPAIYYFLNGKVMDKMIGFEDLGSKDDFKEYTLCRRLASVGAVTLLEEEKFKLKKKKKNNNKIRGEESSDEDY